MLRSEHGQNLIELAIVAPLLVLLLTGIADVGRAFYGYIAITNGAREGARYGARHPSNLATIQAIAVNEAMNSGTQLSNCGATVASQADWDGSALQVTVRCDFTPILMTGPLTLQNAAAMKVEGP